MRVPNPTNAVGGSFILSLQRTGTCASRIPPTPVGGSFILWLQRNGRGRVPNPTNAVGGSFILWLQRNGRGRVPESHQRSWWIVHTLATMQQPAPRFL